MSESSPIKDALYANIDDVGQERIHKLMLNGKFDHFFPLETSQIPMFKLLGTPEKDKKHYVYETGHYVPRDELIKFHLEWLAKYE